MFSIFKKKVAGAAQAAKKIENRDFMEAAIGIMVAVAYADGDAEPAELEKLQQTIQTLPELQGFGPEIGKTVDRLQDGLESDHAGAARRTSRPAAERRHLSTGRYYRNGRRRNGTG